jgi:hypothetical protein
MKQYKSPKNSSRRSFTKSLASSFAAVPLVSAYGYSPQSATHATESVHSSGTMPTIPSPMIIKDHIPPIELSLGNVILPGVSLSPRRHLILQTKDIVRERESNRQVFMNDKMIIRVRVINIDGLILADPPFTVGKIEIWVKDFMRAHLVLRTVDKLQFDLDNGNHKFDSHNLNGPARPDKNMRIYTEGDISLYKVIIHEATGGGINVIQSVDKYEQEIDRILIWTTR